MVITITRKTTRKQFEKLLKRFKNKKGFAAHKFCGAIKFKEDPLAIQKRLRSEWD